MNVSAETPLPHLGNPGKLALKVTDIRLEAITLPHLNTKEVMVVLLDFLARNILSDEHFASKLWRE